MKWAQAKSTGSLIHRVDASAHAGTYRVASCGREIRCAAVWDERPDGLPSGRLCQRCNEKHRQEWAEAQERRSMDTEVSDQFLDDVLKAVQERLEDALMYIDTFYTHDTPYIESIEDLKHVRWHLSNRIEQQARFAKALAEFDTRKA